MCSAFEKKTMQVLISLFGKNTDRGKYNITILPKSNVRIHLFLRETNFMQTIYSIDEVSQQLRHPFVTIPWVGNSYDQAQLRSIRWRTPNTVSSDNHGLCQHGTSFATHIAPGKSHGADYFSVVRNRNSRSDIEDFGSRKFLRIDRNCHTRK